MPLLDSDTFTYSDGALSTVSSAKWTQCSGFSDPAVDEGVVAFSSGAGAAVITTWSGSTTDQYSQLELATAVVAGGGPTIRSNAVSTFYVLEISDGANSDVYKCVGGSFTSLSSVAITWATGNDAYIEMQGNQIITKQNTTTRHNFSDSAIASGKPGLRVYTNGLAFDNWEAGDFSAGGTSIPIPVGSQLMTGRALALSVFAPNNAAIIITPV